MGRRERIALEWLDVSGQLRAFKYIDRFLWNRPHSPATCLAERVAENRNSLALLYADERYTWREVDQHANRYANFFRGRGIGKGDVVALLMDNRPDYVFVTLGLNRLGAVSALINTNITGAGLVHAINIAKPKLAVIGAEHLDAVAAVADELVLAEGSLLCHVEANGDVDVPARFGRVDRMVLAESSEPPSDLPRANSSDVMCYIYTSGTTGLPKAAIVPNRRFLAAAYLFGASIMEATPEDVVYVSLPLYHSSAMYAGLGSTLVSGAAMALRRKFSASHFWKDVVDFDASIFLYIGEVCRYLLNTPASELERGHRIRLGVGNGLRPDVWERFQRRFGVPLIREFYGATEGNAPIVNFAGKPGMVGRLRPGQVLARCDETTGELLRDSRGFCTEARPGEKGILLGKINKLFSFDGYVDQAATKKKVVEDVFAKGDRYFNSGDLLQLHEDRWVSFADRIGDTYRWKGENVSTNEVAEVLNGAEGVVESNVYGVVVPGAEGRVGMASLHVNGNLDLDRFAAFVREKLPAYQRPYFLRIQHEMRITGTFKHQKVDYRDEGFDPSRVSDPLYFLDDGRYVPIDRELFERITKGEIGPR